MPYAQEFHKIHRSKKNPQNQNRFLLSTLKPVVIKRAVVIKDTPGDNIRNLTV